MGFVYGRSNWDGRGDVRVKVLAFGRPRGSGDEGVVRISVSTFCTSVRRESRPRRHNGPVIVTGRPERANHGKMIAATGCVTEGFKVRSTVDTRGTFRLYPRTVFVSPQVGRCGVVSQRVENVFTHCASLVRPLSLSRTCLSIARGGRGLSDTAIVTQEVRERI